MNMSTLTHEHITRIHTHIAQTHTRVATTMLQHHTHTHTHTHMHNTSHRLASWNQSLHFLRVPTTVKWLNICTILVCVYVYVYMCMCTWMHTIVWCGCGLYTFASHPISPHLHSLPHPHHTSLHSAFPFHTSTLSLHPLHPHQVVSGPSSWTTRMPSEALLR